ncbi:hypothetical protein [Streptomyces sp. NPDC057718]|uniref:hypothetical protein n=1 Tax=Streptomyces sp. NPDC057718 TaxID=3346225 RepID=UPI0036970474
MHEWTGGRTTAFTAMPTAAPTRVSSSRCPTAGNEYEPYASTNRAVVGAYRP